MPGDDPETEAQLRPAARGDERARNWLLERHRPRPRRWIAVRFDGRLAARLDPADLVQETPADAARRLEGYLRGRPVPFHPWLHRLASERLVHAHRHHLHALRREAGREQPDGVPWAESSMTRLLDTLPASRTSPRGHPIRQEERLEVWRARGELPDQDRETLVMRYLDQLAFGEIAAILGITAGAAGVRHFRARQRIGPLLGTAGEVPEP
jgi:RNA polymerase sigma-70 factor (ECF subfamily)